MPPITSSRPGARETRSGAPGAAPNVGNSLATRRSSVGTGSRLCRLGRGLGDGSGGGLGDGDGAGGEKLRLLPFENNLAHETPPALVEPHLQHVALVGADRGVSDLEAVGTADAVPAAALVFGR